MTARLPDFVIIGAQKAGTTWLGARLAEQPSVFMSPVLEVRYFSRPDLYAKGLDWYAGHFADAPADAVVGEKTPDYLWTVRPEGRGPNDIPERMHKAVPDARLLVALRNPVKRAISAFNHIIRTRKISPFADPDTVLTAALDPANDRFGLIGRGHYLVHLRRFLEFYPREQMLTVFFEDEVVKAPQATLEKVMTFLNRRASPPVQRRRWPENKRMNTRLGLILNYHMPKLAPVISVIDRLLPEAPAFTPSPACTARLHEHFDSHNRALFSFLGRSTDAWNGT